MMQKYHLAYVGDQPLATAHAQAAGNELADILFYLLCLSGMNLFGSNTLGDFQLDTTVQAPVFGGVAAG